MINQQLIGGSLLYQGIFSRSGRGVLQFQFCIFLEIQQAPHLVQPMMFGWAHQLMLSGLLQRTPYQWCGLLCSWSCLSVCWTTFRISKHTFVLPQDVCHFSDEEVYNCFSLRRGMILLLILGLLLCRGKEVFRVAFDGLCCFFFYHLIWVLARKL